MSHFRDESDFFAGLCLFILSTGVHILLWSTVILRQKIKLNKFFESGMGTG